MTPTLRITQREANLRRDLTRAVKAAALGEMALARNPGLERQAESYRDELIATGLELDRARVDLYEAKMLVATLTAERDRYRAAAAGQPLSVPREREKLPDERRAIGIKLRVNGLQEAARCVTCGTIDPTAPPATSLHLHLGFYADGTLGELFVRLDRERRADVASAFADQWATALSYAVQHGLDIGWLLEKARYVRDGSGGTPYVWSDERERYERHPTIHSVTSVVDYLAAVIGRVLDGKTAARATAEEIAASEALRNALAAGNQNAVR